MNNQIRDKKVVGGDKDTSRTEQKQKELRGDQQPGKSRDSKEPLTNGEGTENKGEDAALAKEEIRSRDA